MFTTGAASTTNTRQFYNNTIMTRMGDGNVTPAWNNGSDDTAALASWNNLFYMECGATGASAAGIAPFIQQGSASAAQVASGTMGYDLIMTGPELGPKVASWTNTTAGYSSHQYNHNYRASATWTGGDVDPNTSALTSQALGAVFAGTTTSWTWTTPDAYTHDLPIDLRPLVGRTVGLGSTVPGAIDDSVNEPPVAGPVTYAVTAGDTLSTTATDGMLSNTTDPDMDTLTASVVSAPATGAFTYSTTTGGFDYTPLDTFAGTTFFTFKAWDGTTFSNVSTCTINVDPYPTPPPGPTTPSITNIIDSAPFFRPILELDARVQFKNTRNRKPQRDLRQYETNKLWEESTHRYLYLATNTTQQITLGGVASATYLIVETDQPIKVAVNSSTHQWPVTDILALLNTAVTSLHVQNESTTNTARVVILAID